MLLILEIEFHMYCTVYTFQLFVDERPIEAPVCPINQGQ